MNFTGFFVLNKKGMILIMPFTIFFLDPDKIEPQKNFYFVTGSKVLFISVGTSLTSFA